MTNPSWQQAIDKLTSRSAQAAAERNASLPHIPTPEEISRTAQGLDDFLASDEGHAALKLLLLTNNKIQLAWTTDGLHEEAIWLDGRNGTFMESREVVSFRGSWDHEPEPEPTMYHISTLELAEKVLTFKNLSNYEDVLELIRNRIDEVAQSAIESSENKR